MPHPCTEHKRPGPLTLRARCHDPHMSDTNAHPFPGPERDLVGYGPEPPRVPWPGGAPAAVNPVATHEEGGESSLADDRVNDPWGEHSVQYGPEIRDLGNEAHVEDG